MEGDGLELEEGGIEEEGLGGDGLEFEEGDIELDDGGEEEELSPFSEGEE